MTLKSFVRKYYDLKTVKTFEKFIEWSEIANKFGKLLIVQGGFAVDLVVGRITRNHDDLDLITLEVDINWFRERFEVDGYKIKHHPEHNPEFSFCAYKYNFVVEDSLYIDVEGINVDDKVWDRGDEKIFVWPVQPSKLYKTLEIDGIKLKFLSPKLVYGFKKKQQQADADVRDKEKHDFRILERFLNGLG